MIELLKKYLPLTEEELAGEVLLELCKYYNPNQIIVGEHNSYYYAQGNIPIVLVAHLDVVFPRYEDYKIEIFYDQEHKVMWSPDGLGTDDRAGVATIIYLLKNTSYRPCILFTKEEETTLMGAYYASKLKPKVNYAIQLDRQGRGECVFYNCDNKDFEEYINSFGFTTQQGSYTDISVFCPKWKCAGVNLSMGYYEEHSYTEHFKLDDWQYTYNNLLKILEDNPEEHKFKYNIKRKTKKEKF